MAKRVLLNYIILEIKLAKWTGVTRNKQMLVKYHWHLFQIPILMKQTKFQTKRWQNGYSIGKWDPMWNLRRETSSSQQTSGRIYVVIFIS